MLRPKSLLSFEFPTLPPPPPSSLSPEAGEHQVHRKLPFLLANFALVAGIGWGKCHEKTSAGNCPSFTLWLRWFKWSAAERSAFAWTGDTGDSVHGNGEGTSAHQIQEDLTFGRFAGYRKSTKRSGELLERLPHGQERGLDRCFPVVSPS